MEKRKRTRTTSAALNRLRSFFFSPYNIKFSESFQYCVLNHFLRIFFFDFHPTSTSCVAINFVYLISSFYVSNRFASRIHLDRESHTWASQPDRKYYSSRSFGRSFSNVENKMESNHLWLFASVGRHSHINICEQIQTNQSKTNKQM